MKLEIGENCFAEQNSHHFYNHHHSQLQQNENYMETSPQYYNIIKTHPVASSTNSNARQLRNDHQCAMTTEETRRLTGLVAKTRALFESSLNTASNLNNETNQNSSINTTPKKTLTNSISINSPFKNYANESSNTNVNYFRIKQSFSANNVNNLRKISLSNSNDQNEINDTPSFKENNKNNFIKQNLNPSTLLTNSAPAKTNYSNKSTKVDTINYSTAYFNESNSNTNNSMTNDSAFSRPSFIKIKSFLPPSMSQSNQMCDSAMSKNNEKENIVSSVKKSQSSNRILFSPNENNQSLNSRANDSNQINIQKQNVVNNGLWSSSVEAREELNIPFSVKHAKMCFENLALNNSNNMTKNNTFTTPLSNNGSSNTSANNTICSMQITPTLNANKLRSDLLVPTNKISTQTTINTTPLTTSTKRLSPINRKFSTPSPLLSSSSSASTSSSDHISIKPQYSSSSNYNGSSVRVSSANGSVSSGVSEIINLFSSSSASSNSTNSNRLIINNNNSSNNNISSSPTTIYNTNSSSAASSSSSCETTPRSTLTNKKQRPPKITDNVILDDLPMPVSVTHTNNLEINTKSPTVANKIKNLEKSFSNNNGKNSQNLSESRKQQQLFGSTSSSSTSSFSSSTSTSSYLNNGTNSPNLAKFTNQSLNKCTQQDKYSQGVYSQSPKFLQLFQSQIEVGGRTPSEGKYRKLEDIITEADSKLTTKHDQISISYENNKQNNPKTLPPKSILRKVSNSITLTPEQHQISVPDNDDLLPINKQTSLYSSSSSCNFNDSLTTKSMLKKTFKEESNSNYDRLIHTQNRETENDIVKIDNSSCVLPSKLRQRSQSLAAEPAKNESQTKNSYSMTPNRISAASSQKINNKAPIYIKNNNINGNNVNSCASNNVLVKRVARNATTAREALLRWCRKQTQEYENISINNFSSSWSNGMAFCALIHHFMPDEFDYTLLNPENVRHNFELAFKVAEDKAGIVSLLDVDDMIEMGNSPDWKCVFTYVHSIYQRFKDPVF